MRKPDTPCAQCGTLLYKGRGSLVAPTCRPCRRLKPSYLARQQAITDWQPSEVRCAVCRATFREERYGQRYCTIRCRNRRPRQPKSEAAKERDRTRVRPPRDCDNCGATYQALHSGHPSKYCSPTCWQASRRTVWPSCRIYPTTCSVCGAVWCSRTKRKTCSTECSKKRNIQSQLDRYRTDPEFRDRVLAQTHARRADKLGLGSKQVLLSYLIKRDRGVCGICHRPVRIKRGPMRPSIDHIIPLSRGGTHELENVQLSHYRCNESKGNRGSGEQLLLLG